MLSSSCQLAIRSADEAGGSGFVEGGWLLELTRWGRGWFDSVQSSSRGHYGRLLRESGHVRAVVADNCSG
ncbi:hypothetical protein C495_08415 [Natronorubrum sulfidifaciens JCM 14089]|uniref:Uncharacterized protein n=1 Tax=Natronorubrum sulfidifaciens JCM 14089 TaxID=1230460 RepID=L9W6H9_9EURY|nr:hypothetical protein C495_08415 [Natronorubrum sulfidifaciens JCM 14089]